MHTAESIRSGIDTLIFPEEYLSAIRARLHYNEGFIAFAIQDNVHNTNMHHPLEDLPATLENVHAATMILRFDAYKKLPGMTLVPYHRASEITDQLLQKVGSASARDFADTTEPGSSEPWAKYRSVITPDEVHLYTLRPDHAFNNPATSGEPSIIDVSERLMIGPLPQDPKYIAKTGQLKGVWDHLAQSFTPAELLLRRAQAIGYETQVLIHPAAQHHP